MRKALRAADAGLGRDYGKLWTSSACSTFGDGIYLTALLLMAAGLTRDPVLLSTVSVAGTLPGLLFALPGGALADRVDRRRIMWVTDAVRFGFVALVAAAVATDRLTIGLLAAVSFALATGEILYTTASQSIVPQIVSRAPERLQRANSRLVSAQILLRDFVGRPLGGALYGVVAWLPPALNALSFGLASALIASVPSRPTAIATARTGLLADLREGMRWLWRHRLLRTLAFAVCIDNFAFMLWNSVLVLMLQDRFGLGGFGFGVMTACLGIGGIVGSLGVSWVSRRAGIAATMMGAMVLEGLATVVVGLTSERVVAGAMLFAVGAAAIGWNVVTVSLRQSLVPAGLQGRVNGTYRLVALAGAPAGAALGGLIGTWQGLRAPFLWSAAVVLLCALMAARVVNRRSVAEAEADVEEDAHLDAT
nr:MFS transporter [Streptomyces sp. SID8382]